MYLIFLLVTLEFEEIDFLCINEELKHLLVGIIRPVVGSHVVWGSNPPPLSTYPVS